MNSTYQERIREMIDLYTEYEQHEEYHIECPRQNGHVDYDEERLLADLLTLIQEVAKSAKPDEQMEGGLARDPEGGSAWDRGFNSGVDQYEQNIIKELGGSDG